MQISASAKFCKNITLAKNFKIYSIELSILLQVTSETGVTEILDKITSVSDADYGDDGSFVYDIVGIPDVSFGKKYFTVTDNGELRVRKPIELNYDIDFEFTISG